MGFIKTPEEEIRELSSTWTGSGWDFSKIYPQKDTLDEMNKRNGAFEGRIYVTDFTNSNQSNKSNIRRLNSEGDLSDYIIIEGKAHGSYSHPDLLVSKDLENFGVDWYETHKILNKNDQLMITLRQFIDFINLLRSDRKVFDGNGKHIDKYETKQILHKIIKRKATHTAEWLDARFDLIGDELYISYNHLTTVDGELVPRDFEPLKPCLMEDTYVVFFNFFSDQGMPKRKSKNSGLYYRCPADHTVARFKVDSRNLNLFCDWWPTDSDPFNGVRPVLMKKH